MDAEALPTAGAAQTPAKKRQTHNETISPARADPNVKTMNPGVVTTKTILRPYVSLNGDPSIGPAARPRLYRDSGKTATECETLNSAETSSMPGLYIDAANAVTNARTVTATVE